MGNHIIEQEKIVDNSEKKFTDIWQILPGKNGKIITSSGKLLTTMDKQDLKKYVLDLIGRARETLFISTFLLASEEVKNVLINSADRGVRIYMLSSTDAVLKQDLSDETGEFTRNKIESHIQLLKELSGIINLRSAKSFHAKFILKDAKHSPEGVLLTCNLTEAALVRNPEVGVILDPEEVRELAGLFIFSFWETAEKELYKNTLKPVKPEKRYSVPPGKSLLATCATRKGILEQILSLLEDARETIVLTSFGIGHEKIINLLCRKSREGVNITLLTRETRKNQLPVLRTLEMVGVTVIGIPFIHAKSLIVDRRQGLITTANFENHGLEQGFEIGIALHEKECSDLSRLYEAWYQKKYYLFYSSITLGRLKRSIKIPAQQGMKEISIEESKTFECGVLRKACLTLKNPEPDFNTYKIPDTVEVKKIIYRWNVELPVLSHRATPFVGEKKRKNKRGTKKPENVPYSIYMDMGKKVFAVKNEEEAKNAESFMAQYKIKAIVLEE